jgi:hypothetical protein
MSELDARKIEEARYIFENLMARYLDPQTGKEILIQAYVPTDETRMRYRRNPLLPPEDGVAEGN